MLKVVLLVEGQTTGGGIAATNGAGHVRFAEHAFDKTSRAPARDFASIGAVPARLLHESPTTHAISGLAGRMNRINRMSGRSEYSVHGSQA